MTSDQDDRHEMVAAIRRIHERVRDAVVQESERVAIEELAQVTDDESEGDTIYAIDRISEELIVELFENEVANKRPLVLIAEGISGGRVTLPRGSSESDAAWQIVVDPIDGTRDFVRRTPFWSVLMALEAGGEIVLGIMYFPCLKETLHASLGSGCFHNGTRVTASKINRIDKAILMISGFKSAWEAWTPETVQLLTQQCWTVRAYCGCYDIAMLARGKADIWLSGSGMEWDYAPARIVARECGAAFLTRDGGDRIDAGHCLICVPGLEQELRRTLKIP